MQVKLTLDKGPELPLKAIFTESQRVFANRTSAEMVRCGFETFDGIADRVRSLLVEMIPGDAVDDSLARAAPAVGQHRRTASLSFNRSDSVIFLRRENESPGALQAVTKNFVGLKSKYPYVGPGQFLQLT